MKMVETFKAVAALVFGFALASVLFPEQVSGLFRDLDGELHNRFTSAPGTSGNPVPDGLRFGGI